MKLKCFAILTSGIVVFFSAWAGREVPFSEQWPLYEALRTTAAIIFAVVGAWLAIIYPDRLRVSFKQLPENAASKNGKGLAQLFTPVVHSTAILCVILLIGILAPIIKRLDYLQEYHLQLRGISYGVLVSLTLWQLWTVILSLIPADVVMSQANRDERHQKVVGDFTRRGGFVKKSDTPEESDEDQ